MDLHMREDGRNQGFLVEISQDYTKKKKRIR